MKPIDKAKTWYVVRTNVQKEAKAAENIRLAGFDVYFPRQRYEKKHKRTHVYTTLERPLMLRYLFVGFQPKSKHFGFVRACDGVERFLEVLGEPVPVAGKDVEAIYLAEVDMAFDDTRAARIHRKEEAKTRKLTLEMRFKAGKRVEVTEGPFASFHAIVEEVTKTGNIKVMLDLFGRFTPAEFEASQLSAA